MAQEKEVRVQIKIPLVDFRQRLLAAGFKYESKANYLDIYFDTPEWDLYNHIALLRIRKVNGKEHSFSFKKVFYLPANIEPYYIEEIEAPLPITDKAKLSEIAGRIGYRLTTRLPVKADDLYKLLIAAGFQDEQTIPKTREKYVLNDIEVTIDEIDQVGTMIEFETKESDPFAELYKILLDNELERVNEGIGYIWLRNTKGFTKHLKNLRRFKQEPEWNILENERDFYAQIKKK